MAEVLLDNWGLSECVNKNFREKNFYGYYNSGNKYVEDICWQNFLTSIILWDDVYMNSSQNILRTPYSANTIFDDCLHSGTSMSTAAIYWLNTIFKNLSFVHTLEESSETMRLSENHEINKLLETLKRTEFDKINSRHKALLILGYRYVIEANELGYNYLPHPERAEFLRKSGVFNQGFNRKIYMDILDNEVKKYIEDVNKLCNNSLFKTNFPVLYKFISENTSSPREEFMYALELRNDKNVVKFRESVNEIEKSLNNGNILELKRSLDCTKEICDAITTDIYKQPLSFGVSLGLSPALNINLDDKNKKRTKSSLHTTFLYDITKFAVTGKKGRRYKYDGLK